MSYNNTASFTTGTGDVSYASETNSDLMVLLREQVDILSQWTKKDANNWDEFRKILTQHQVQLDQGHCTDDATLFSISLDVTFARDPGWSGTRGYIPVGALEVYLRDPGFTNTTNIQYSDWPSYHADRRDWKTYQSFLHETDYLDRFQTAGKLVIETYTPLDEAMGYPLNHDIGRNLLYANPGPRTAYIKHCRDTKMSTRIAESLAKFSKFSNLVSAGIDRKPMISEAMLGEGFTTDQRNRFFKLLHPHLQRAHYMTFHHSVISVSSVKGAAIKKEIDSLPHPEPPV